MATPNAHCGTRSMKRARAVVQAIRDYQRAMRKRKCRHRAQNRFQIGCFAAILEPRIAPAAFPIGTFSGTYTDMSYESDDSSDGSVDYPDSGVITMTLYVADPLEGFLGGSVTITGYPQGTLTIPVEEGLDYVQPDGFYSVAFQYPVVTGALAPSIQFSISGYSHDPNTFDVTDYELFDSYNNPAYSTDTSTEGPVVLTAQSTSPGPTLPSSYPLVFHLSTPSVIAPGERAEATIDYTNVGTAAVPAPLLILSTAQGNATLSLPNQDDQGTTLQILPGDPNSTPFGLLPPGFTNQITIDVTPTTSGPLQFLLNAQSQPAEAFDWQTVASDVPPGDTAADWGSVVDAAQTRIGNTWGAVLGFIDKYVPADPGADADGFSAANAVYDFAALLTYVTADAGTDSSEFAAADLPANLVANAAPGQFQPPPGYSVLGQVPNYVAVYQYGNLAANPDRTFVISHGLGGNQDRFFLLAEAIREVDPKANVFVVDWTPGAKQTFDTIIGNPPDPFGAVPFIDPDGDKVTNILTPLVKSGAIKPSTTTFVGESFGNDLLGRVAKDFQTSGLGKVGNALVFNPASNASTYSVPDFSKLYVHPTAFITDSNFDEKNVSAEYRLKLNDLPPEQPPDDTQLHINGINWLTNQLKIPSLQTMGKLWLDNAAPLKHGPYGSQFDGTAEYDGSYTPTIDAFPPPPFDPAEVDPINEQPENVSLSTRAVLLKSNSTVGPAGQGPSQDVAGDQVIPYQLNFDGSSAPGGPGQSVTIEDPLGPGFDPGSFNFGDVTLYMPDPSVGPQYIEFPIPQGDDSYSTSVSDPDFPGVDVSLDSSFDTSTDTSDWTFSYTDLSDLNSLLDAFHATPFTLPANLPALQGSVHFTVRPKAEATSGTVIRDQAKIIIGKNAPIITAAVSNTIEKGLPSSQVLALPATSTSPIVLHWSGQDGAGPGISNFTIFVSTDGGAYAPLLVGTSATSTSFAAAAGHTYRFYSLATDWVGNRQASAGTPAITQVVSASSPLVTVTGIRELTNKKHQLTGILVTFSGAVNSSEADRTSGIYRLALPGKKGSYTAKNATVVKLKSAVYSTASKSVTLTLKKPLALKKIPQLLINGSAPSGLQDSAGRLIDGDGNGTAGGNVVAILSRGGAIRKARASAIKRQEGFAGKTPVRELN